MIRTPRPRLVDVARALDVSITTVSNAFHRPDQLSPALRALVLRRAEAMGYPGPGAEARLLPAGHAGAIAFYNPEPLDYLVRDPVAVRVVDGLVQACQERQAGLLILPTVPHTRHDRPRPPAAIDVAAVDGFVLYSLADDDPVIGRALDRGRPLACIDMDRRGLPPSPTNEAIRVAWINVDDRGGARAAIEHLLGSGRRRIGVVSLPLDRRRTAGFVDDAALSSARIHPTRQRWLGCRDALSAAGIDVGAVPVYAVAGNGEQAGEDAAEALLSAHPTTDALLVMSDALTLGVLTACASNRRNVPRDVAVVGFDDVDGRIAATGATMIRQDAQAKGYAAAEALLLGETAMKATILPVTLAQRRTA